MTHSSQRLWTPVFAIAVASVVAALLASALTHRNETPAERIGRIANMGELETAERLAWQELQSHPGDLQLWLRFIDIHAELLEHTDETEAPATVGDTSVRQLLARAPKGPVATLATFWYETKATANKPDAAPVRALADAPKPARYANYLLGRLALEDETQWNTAAQRFEREGFAFPKASERYLRRAIGIWIEHDAWNEVRKRVNDPHYASIVDASLRLELAEQSRDWAGILLWLWPAGYVHVEVWPIALAILAAVLWIIITTRLGRIGDGVEGRSVLYALAFILGVLSIYPTLVTGVIEESIFHFKEVNQPLPDAIYYIVGVGLREEIWKLLLFLPLLPRLLDRGSRIEALTCGALVGLGFAAEENISYFERYNAAVAMSRFLTANFFHMSMTAIIAVSVFDAARGRSTPRDRPNVLIPIVVAIHGAYDFFLSSPEFASFSLVSMILLIFVARQFLRQLVIATSREEEEDVLQLFVWSLAILTGVSYIYATTLVGPWVAVRMIAVGGLGVVFVVYMFVRELT